jgi:hypothetical protein
MKIQWVLKLWYAHQNFANFKIKISNDTDNISNRIATGGMLYDPSLDICMICMYYICIDLVFFRRNVPVTPTLVEKKDFLLEELTSNRCWFQVG